MFTEEIAGFIINISFPSLPQAAIEASKMAILDCLGVALAGSKEVQSKIVSEYVRGGGRYEAGIIGDGFKASMEQAAWVNGTKAHALDYDDYFNPDHLTPYHPTVAILPAVLAVGEKNNLSGKEILLAFIAGFEVEAQIAMTCVEEQYNLGWHTTSTLGSIGAAAAVAKLLQLDDHKIRMALGIAGSLAGGLRKNFGTMTKPLHAGNAAKNGVIAALLAQKGFVADKNILDRPMGFCEVLGGAAVNPEKLSRMKGMRKNKFFIVSPGIAFKPYPSCAYSHWAIDAALGLRNEALIKPEDIAEIECRTSSDLPKVLIHSRPATAMEAKFSLEFCVALALIDGEVSLEQFSDTKVKDQKVQGLIKKIKYVHPPEMGSGLVNLLGEVVVKLQSGKLYSKRVDAAKGDPKNPLTGEEMAKKFKDCCHRFLSSEDSSRALDLIANFDSISGIDELMNILTFRSTQP